MGWPQLVAKESSEPLRFGQADHHGIVWRLKTVGDFLRQYAAHTPPEWLDHDGRPCNPQTCGILTRRPIRDGDRYLVTKESLTWGDDPAHAFQTPQPAAFLEPRGVALTPSQPGYWGAVLLPAIKMIGLKAVADRLRLNMSTVTRWIAGKRRPEDIAQIERAIASLAGEFGLFSDHEIEHLNDAAIAAAIPERVLLAAFFNVFATNMLAAQSGARALATTIGASHSTVVKWAAVGAAPTGIPEINAFLGKIAKAVRAELRKTGCRAPKGRGPVGDRLAIWKYLSVLSGLQKPEKLPHPDALAVPVVITLAAIFVLAVSYITGEQRK